MWVWDVKSIGISSEYDSENNRYCCITILYNSQSGKYRMLLATSMGLLITTLVPTATCGLLRSIQTTLTTPGTSTSIQTTSTSTTTIVTSAFLFVVSQAFYNI